MNISKITAERERLGIQLLPEQLHSISKVLRKNYNLLVFGVGNDTSFWLEANKKGHTVFIEDNPSWLKKIQTKNPGMNAYLVTYGTKLLNWQKLLDKTEKLNLKLPKAITDIAWDVILVDAPRGYKNHHPGRMKSIYTALKLLAHTGHIFVHDCDRLAEKVYTDTFLKNENLVEEIGILRHYKISNKHYEK